MTRQANDFLQNYPVVGWLVIGVLCSLIGWLGVRQLEGIDNSISEVAVEMKGMRQDLFDQQKISLRNSYRLDACEQKIKDCGQ